MPQPIGSLSLSDTVAAMFRKDPGLFERIKHMPMLAGYAEWRVYHPEDFVEVTEAWRPLMKPAPDIDPLGR